MAEPEHDPDDGYSESWGFGGRFNFKIEHFTNEDDQPTGWAVTLPHQCDAWGIAGGSYTCEPAKEALEALEVFIDEALRVRRWFRDRIIQEQINADPTAPERFKRPF